MNIAGEKTVEGAPDLVVEVISPSTFYYDTRPKFRNYEKYRVREFWIVDPGDRSVEIFVLEDGRFLPARRAEGSGTVESRVLAGFTVDLKDIFYLT
jgi:Uma2 family endonuclease